MKMKIKGPYAVLMTPFDGETVDGEAFVNQIKRLNDTDLSGYVVNGSTSEFIQLSPDEQKRMGFRFVYGRVSRTVYDTVDFVHADE